MTGLGRRSTSRVVPGVRLIGQSAALQRCVRRSGSHHVAGPVSAVGGDCFGGGASGDADGVGEECGWDLAGELGDGGGSLVSGLDVESAEPVAEAGDGDVTVGVVVCWEQPAGGEQVGDASVASVWQLVGEGGEGFGQLDLVCPEVDDGCGVADGELLSGEGGDAGEGLRVEHHEGAGDAVVGVDGVVVDESAGVFPSLRVVGRCGRGSCGRAGWHFEVGGEVVLALGPAQERRDGCRCGTGLGEPVVDVALSAVAETACVVVEGVDEGGDVNDGAAQVRRGVHNAGAALGASADAGKGVPAQPGRDDATVGGVANLRCELDRGGFDAGEAAFVGLERADDDEESSETFDAAAVVFVKGVVTHFELAASELGEQSATGAGAQPCARGRDTLGAPQRCTEIDQPCRWRPGGELIEVVAK